MALRFAVSPDRRPARAVLQGDVERRGRRLVEAGGPTGRAAGLAVSRREGREVVSLRTGLGPALVQGEVP